MSLLSFSSPLAALERLRVWFFSACTLLLNSLRYQFQGEVELSPVWLWRLDIRLCLFLTPCYVDKSCPCWRAISPTLGIVWFDPHGASRAPTMRPLRSIDSQLQRTPAVGCMCVLGGEVFYGCAEKTIPSLKSYCFVWHGESSGFRGDSSHFGGRLGPSYKSVVGFIVHISNQRFLERKESGAWICSGWLLP